MKIKITEAGKEGFTGQLGDVQFVDGVSVGEITDQAIAHVSSIFSVDRIGDEVTEKVTKKDAKPQKEITPVEAEKVVTVISDETPETTVTDETAASEDAAEVAETPEQASE